jgi:hypothetical protein
MPVIPFRSPRTPFAVQPPPAPTRSSIAIGWLRRMHIWIGLWGAVLGLLFGATGILLNHRDALPPGAGQAQATTIQLPLPVPAPRTPQAMADWLKAALKLGRDPASVSAEAARPVAWGEHALVQPARWTAGFASPAGAVQAEYWVGNNYVTVTRSDNDLLATLSSLHKGTGMGVAWVLLVDTLAGSIILLSLSGALLWALTARRRALGLAIGAASLLAAGGLALAAW